jgi:hypothetical protein
MAARAPVLPDLKDMAPFPLKLPLVPAAEAVAEVAVPLPDELEPVPEVLGEVAVVEAPLAEELTANVVLAEAEATVLGV